MSNQDNKERWVTREASAKLSSLLNLVTNPFMQDWELECADAQRVEEFLAVYEQDGLNADDRFALMALIVASFDALLSDKGMHEPTMTSIRQLLTANFTLHEATIRYWCLWDESDTDNLFTVTPFMREIWRQRK